MTFKKYVKFHRNSEVRPEFPWSLHRIRIKFAKNCPMNLQSDCHLGVLDSINLSYIAKRKKVCSTIFFDVVQAFDKVWQKGLIYTIEF